VLLFLHLVGGAGEREIIAIVAYVTQVLMRREGMEILTKVWLIASEGGRDGTV